MSRPMSEGRVETNVAETPWLASSVRWVGVGANSVFWPAVSFAWAFVERTGPRQHSLMMWWSRACLRSAGVRVHALGIENVLRDRPQIFFSSHASIADICILASVLPVEYRWLARKEVFRIPIIGWYLSVTRHVKIDRGDRSTAIRLLADASARVRAGSNLLVFPEGTRSPDGGLLPFKKGVFHLAIDSGVPIVPVRILGSHRIIPKGSGRLGSGDVDVVVGTPIPTDGLDEDDLPALMARVRTAMRRAETPGRRCAACPDPGMGRGHGPGGDQPWQ